jgi:hypothetical protein
MLLKRLDQLKYPLTSSEIESATFRLVVPQPTALPRVPWYHPLLCKNQRRIFGPKRGEIIGLKKVA